MDTTVAARPVIGSRFVIGLATEADDADLRCLLRETPMPGPIQVSLEREPNFFAAARAEGGRLYTAVIRDRQTGQLAGMGSRVVRKLFVNGQPQWVGYLSQLRISSSYRHLSRQLLRMGFGLLRETHTTDEAPFDITTIVADNAAARRLLEMELPGLPRYTPVGRILTMLLPPRAMVTRRGMERYQFSPVEPLPAIWDQREFKQIVVRGYSPWLRRCRWLFGLPPVGSVLPLAYLTGKTDVVPDDCRWLVIGLSDRHPLAPELRRRYRPRVYASLLYVVHEPGATVELDDRIPHVEVALL